MQKTGNRPANSLTGRHAIVDRAVEESARLVGHAEATGSQGFIDVLRCCTNERDLEVVDDGGAVGRDRRNEPPLHQIDQHRPQTVLDHVGTNTPQDAAAFLPGLHECRDDGFQVGGGQNARQRIDPGAK